MQNRGVIKNRTAAAQLRDFSGMCFGTITPTDIDGLIEYKNKLFVFIETKYNGTELPQGQKLALERLCDATTKAGKESIVFVTSHNVSGPNDIDFAETIVTEYRYKFRWFKSETNKTLKDAVASFIKKHSTVE